MEEFIGSRGLTQSYSFPLASYEGLNSYLGKSQATRDGGSIGVCYVPKGGRNHTPSSPRMQMGY